MIAILIIMSILPKDSYDSGNVCPRKSLGLNLSLVWSNVFECPIEAREPYLLVGLKVDQLLAIYFKSSNRPINGVAFEERGAGEL